MAEHSRIFFPFEGFLDLLRDNGFQLGIDAYLRVQHLVNQLPPGTTPAQLRTLLCPIFAHNEQAQRRFYRLFDHYFSDLTLHMDTQVLEPESEAETPDQQPVKPRWRFRVSARTHRWLFIVLSLLLTSLAVYIPIKVYLAFRGTSEREGAWAYLERYGLTQDAQSLPRHLAVFVLNDLLGLPQPCDELADVGFEAVPGPTDDSLPTRVAFRNLGRDTLGFRRWDLGNGDRLLGVVSPTYSYGDTGTYTVSLLVRNAYGCEAQARQVLTLTLETNCQAGFTWAQDPENELRVVFSDTSVVADGDQVVEQRWDFGDDNNSEGQGTQLDFVYPQYRAYRVCLTIKTQQGCVSTTCKVLRLEDPDGLPQLYPIGPKPFQAVKIAPTGSPFSALYPFFIAIFLLVAGICYELYRFTRRRMVRRREAPTHGPFTWPMDWPDPLPVFAPEVLHDVATHLRRRQESDLYVLDLEGTIGATLEAGGYPSFRYELGTRPSEYLVLIEQRSPRDHQAAFFAEFCRQVAGQDVYMDIFFFPPDFSLFRRHPQASPLRLEDLRVRFPGHRLLILGDGEALVDAITGSLRPETYALTEWRYRAVCTPVAPAHWGFQEVSLGRHFLLVPAMPVVMTQILDFFEMDPPPPPTQWRTLVSDLPPDFDSEITLTDLQDYLGPEGFAWLAACAIYPELHWDLTRHLGRVLEREMGETLVTEARLRRMLRIPWFRQGAIPDPMRVALVETIPPERHRALREAVLQVLEYNEPSGGCYAANRHEAYKTVQQWEMAGGQWLQRRRLTEQIEDLVERNEIDDMVVMDRLERNRGGIGWSPSSEAMRSVLYRQGIPALGINGWVRLSVMGLVVVSLFLYVFQSRIDLRNIINFKQWISRSSNIVKVDGAYIRLRDAKDSAAYFSYMGGMYYDQGDFGSAYNQFDAAVELDPLRALYYYQRGLADYRLTRYPKDDSALAEIYRDFAFARSLRPYFQTETAVTKVWETASGPMKGGKILPDGSGFVGIEGNVATLYQWREGYAIEPVRRFAQREAIGGIDISADQRYLLTLSGREVILWDLQAGEELGALRAHKLPVTVARFSHDGEYILTGSEDYLAILWNRGTRMPIHTLEYIHTGEILDVDFSPDSRYLLTTSADSMAAVWDRSTGQFVANFFGPDQPIRFGRFLADSRHLLTASAEGEAVLWDMRGDSLRHLKLAGAPLGALAVSPDGSMIGYLQPGQQGSHAFQLRNLSGSQVLADLGASLPLPPGVAIAEQRNTYRQMRGEVTVAPQVSFSAGGKRLLVSLPEGGMALFEAGPPFNSTDLRHYIAFNQALIRYETGEFRGAYSAFSELLQTRDSDPGIYYGRGLTGLYLTANDPVNYGPEGMVKALRDLEQAINRDSSYIDSVRMLAPFIVQLFNQHTNLASVQDQICRTAEKYLPGACSMLVFEEVLPFQEGLAAVRKGDLWGYIDTSRRLVIPRAYEDASNFVNGLALVRPQGSTRFVLIDTAATVVYDVVETASEDMIAVRTPRRLWGFLEKGTYALRIEPVFDFAESFYRGYAKVQQGKYYGFIDRQGRPVFEGLVYSEIKGNFAQDTVVQVRYNGRWQRLAYQPPVTRQMQESAPVRRDPELPPLNNLPASEGITVEGPASDGLIRASRQGRYGYLQAPGGTYQQQMPGPGAGPVVAIEFQYEEAYDFSFGRAAVRKPGGLWGFVNTSGRAVTGFIFDQVGVFGQEDEQPLARVSRLGQTYYIDRSGNCVAWKGLVCPNATQRQEVPPAAPAESFVDKETQLVVYRENNLWGLRRSDGSVVISPQFAQPFTFQEGLARVQVAGRWGFIDTKGDRIVPCIYEEAKEFSSGLAAVRRNQSWGFINGRGEVVIPFDFDEVRSFLRGKAIVRQGKSFFTIDAQGQRIGSRKK